MSAQFLEQDGAQHDVAVLLAFAVLNVHDHALAIDIADLQARELGAAHTGAVEGHQNSAIEGSRRGIDELCYFFLTENGGQAIALSLTRATASTPASGRSQTLRFVAYTRTTRWCDRPCGLFQVPEQNWTGCGARSAARLLSAEKNHNGSTVRGSESLPGSTNHATLSGVARMKKAVVNLPASVRQRLLNLATERNEDFGLVLSRYGLSETIRAERIRDEAAYE
jgi:hypothetical protein